MYTFHKIKIKKKKKRIYTLKIKKRVNFKYIISKSGLYVVIPYVDK